ncbi:uncharacterized protein BT62DRAFT_982555 [Guyanagaster necrorhizus]|uniref:Uncharacterized protein n=1 Tax=Guyanagaster necrorhizus TaxID=856835 RepID=A0A9P7VJ95_9AGAR|nr:uncharacterized protein BT62DRAFT_982555 [Guyanagaster necrorhizus MCA 3950]KAG7442156.1 hypothetical protein BT62DRAFT_982555 [Guyanagaster necrorhizus MCA 3950]
MKLVALLGLLAASVASAVVIHPEFDTRADLPSPECVAAIKNIGLYHSTYDASCAQLVYNCLANLNGTKDLWSTTSCVTGATCQGTNSLVRLAQCYDSNIGNASDISHLSYNIFADIVGDCAWQEGGCPITFQNYIDWFYGALTAINSTVWPSDVETVRTNWWNYILDWTLTGDTLPYTNFDDWLHYSNTS